MSGVGHRYSGWQRIGIAIVLVVVLLIAVAIGSWFWSKTHQPRIVEVPPAPVAMLMQPIPEGPNATLLRRGRYLTVAGDCVSCHTRAKGPAFNGGLGVQTPFGVIYSPDLTGNKITGVGNWNNDLFFHALNAGVAADGTHLYPAFPFPHFTVVSRADSDAILAYLKTVPGTAYTPPHNHLPFPINLRISAAAWHLLFFSNHDFRSDPSKTPAWNRGAYLVGGLGHCGACHTPKNIFGAE